MRELCCGGACKRVAVAEWALAESRASSQWYDHDEYIMMRTISP